MSKIISVLKNNLLYKALLLILMLVMTIPYCNVMLAPYVRFFLLWGGIYIIYDFVTGRRLWRSRSLLLLLGFGLCYAVTIFVNRDSYFVANLKALAYMIMVFMIFYGHDPKRNREDLVKEIRILSNVIMGVTFILSLVCFGTYLFSVEYVYFVNDVPAFIGMFEERLWGIYNANTGGALNVLSIFITIGMLGSEGWKYGKRQWFYWGNLILQALCLLLTYSRTSIYAMLIGGAAGLAIFQWQKKKRVFVCIVAAAVFLTGGFLGTEVLRPVLLAVPDAVHELKVSMIDIFNLSDIIAMEPIGEAALPEELVEHKGGILTGRPVLWVAGIGAWQEAPLLGVTREGLYDVAVEHLTDLDWSRDIQVGGLHNIYLTILASSGVIGACFYVFFLLITWKRLLTLAWKRQCPPLLVLGMTFLMVYLIMETMEGRTMYQMNIFFVVFWMYYGYTMCLAESLDSQKMEFSCFRRLRTSSNTDIT